MFSKAIRELLADPSVQESPNEQVLAWVETVQNGRLMQTVLNEYAYQHRVISEADQKRCEAQILAGEKARERILKSFLKVIAKTAGQYGKEYGHEDDLFQIGVQATYKAVAHFNKYKGSSFIAYLYAYLQDAFGKHSRRYWRTGANKARAMLTADLPLSENNEEEVDEERFPDPHHFRSPHSEGRQQWLLEQMQAWVEEQPTEERDTIVLAFGLYDGIMRTNGNVCQILRKPKPQVNRIIKKAKQALREKFPAYCSVNTGGQRSQRPVSGSLTKW